MSQYLATLALAAVGNIGDEAQAIRSTLEYFGFRVIFIPIGRPNDFIAVLNKSWLYPDVQYILICAHGDDGAIIMPELAEDVYEPNEPHGPFFPALIKEYGNLRDINVVCSACTLGQDHVARAFLSVACESYIAPIEHVDGNATLLFIQNLFYHLAKGLTMPAAFQLAQKIDEETKQFRYYSN